MQLFGSLVEDLLAVQLQEHFAAPRTRVLQGSPCNVWYKKQAGLAEVGQLISLSQAPEMSCKEYENENMR